MTLHAEFQTYQFLSVQKYGYTEGLMKALEGLQKSGKLKKWGKAAADLQRRNTMMGELRMVGCVHNHDGFCT